MYAEERQHAIAGLVAERGRVSVAAVAERFGVTTETVRRDLAVLERAGVLRRVHGGAVPAGAALTPGRARRSASGGTPAPRPSARSPPRRSTCCPAPTAASSSTAAPRPPPSPTCCRPTAGSTSPPTPCRSPRGSPASAGITLHVLGGRVRGITQTAVGDATVRALADLRVDVAFLGTNGISPGHGFSTPDEAEAATKRAMARAAQRVVVLADSSKLGREHLVRFAGVDDVDVLVTDGEADPGVVAELETLGIEVLVA